MKHPVPDSDALVFECDLPAPPDKVWRALTECQLRDRWLKMPADCEILESDPGRKLRWRQREPADPVAPRSYVESVVTFELSVIANGGTHLRVVHDSFTRCIAQARATATVLQLRPRTTVASLVVKLRRAA